jgi:uncharacterized OsmC-like protein
MRMILTIRNYMILGLLFVALTRCSNTSTVTIADETGKNIESLKAKAEYTAAPDGPGDIARKAVESGDLAKVKELIQNDPALLYQSIDKKIPN